MAVRMAAMSDARTPMHSCSASSTTSHWIVRAIFAVNDEASTQHRQPVDCCECLYWAASSVCESESSSSSRVDMLFSCIDERDSTIVLALLKRLLPLPSCFALTGPRAKQRRRVEGASIVAC